MPPNIAQYFKSNHKPKPKDGSLNISASLTHTASGTADDEEPIQTFSRKRKSLETNKSEPLSSIQNIESETAEPPSRKESFQRKKQTTQLHLDVGQRNFHGTKCQECGFLYTPGDPEDERLHKLQHNSSIKGLRHTSHSDDKIVKKDGKQGTILALRNSGRQQKQVQKLADFMEGQLGTVPGWVLDCPEVTLLIYVSSDVPQRIIGCIVLQKVKEAHPVICEGSNDNCSVGDETQPPGILVTDPTTRVAVQWGVRLMWVSLEARRRGIATKLLDAARSYLVPGYIIPKNKLAFTQPTEQGTGFIRKYTGTLNFLIYSGSSL